MVIRPKSTAYHSELNTKLISLGRKSYLDIRSLNEGVFVLGGTGSGKSSGPLALLAKAFLKANFGGIVVTTKPEETAFWKKQAQEEGRLEDLVIIDENLTTRINILDFCAATMGANGFDHNIVALLMQISESLAIANGESKGDDNPFFKAGSIKWLSATIPLLRVAYGTIRMVDIYEMIISAPSSPAQLSDERWLQESFCAKTIRKVVEKDKAGIAEAARVVTEYTDFWLKELPELTGKTRASLVATLTNSINPLLSGAFHQLFCTTTNWVPQMARQSGKILLVSLPVLKFGTLSAAIQSVLISQFCQALQAEKTNKNTRPCFVFSDEYQMFAHKSHSDILATCRSSKISFVMATQDISTLRYQLGNNDLADSIINKAGLKLFLSNLSNPTNQYAADVIGKTTRYNESISTNFGENSGSGLNQAVGSGSSSGGEGRTQSQGKSYSTRIDYHVQPSFFSNGLLTGGPENRNTVSGILVRNGHIFPETGNHHLHVSFQQ